MAADTRPGLRKDLIEYCCRVPPAVNSGSYDLAIKFKADVRSCRRLADKPAATAGELSAGINKLHSYWTGEVSVADKVAYVKAQTQTRDHHCHWPGCDKQVPPAMWGCRQHWYTLPQDLRNRIWMTYRPGQERDWTPSAEYLAVAKAVQQWIRENEAGQ